MPEVQHPCDASGASWRQRRTPYRVGPACVFATLRACMGKSWGAAGPRRAYSCAPTDRLIGINVHNVEYTQSRANTGRPFSSRMYDLRHPQESNG